MIPYILLFAFLIACHVLSNLNFFKNKKILNKIIAVWLPIIALILISTFKSNSVGNDTSGYCAQYINARTDSITSLNFRLKDYEIGFRYLFIAFSKMGLPFRVFQLFLYSVIYGLLGIILQKEVKYPTLAILIFCLWSWMIFDFSALRQGLADMIVFFALFLASRKTDKIVLTIFRYVFALVLFGAAYFLHRSSLVFSIAAIIVTFYSIVTQNFAKLNIIVLAAIPIVFLLSPELYQQFFYLFKSNRYIPSERSDVGELFILYYFIFIFGFLFGTKNVVSVNVNKLADKITSKISKKPILEENSDNTENKLSYYSSISLLMFGIGVGVESFSAVCYTALRISNPFLMAAIIVIPNVISVNKSKTLRITAQVCVILLFFLTFYIDYYRTNYLSGFPLTFF